jgi:hypothetical protein
MHSIVFNFGNSRMSNGKCLVYKPASPQPLVASRCGTHDVSTILTRASYRAKPSTKWWVVQPRDTLGHIGCAALPIRMQDIMGYLCYSKVASR